MKGIGNFTFAITLVAGSLIAPAIAPSSAAQSKGGKAPTAMEGTSGEPTPSDAATDRPQTKKKRRSSGKHITEDTVTTQRPTTKDETPHGSERGSKGSRAEVGSGGGGVTGAVGR